jgi:hypothetical protein
MMEWGCNCIVWMRPIVESLDRLTANAKAATVLRVRSQNPSTQNDLRGDR